MLPAGVPAGYKLLLDQPFAAADSLAAILAGNPADWSHGEENGGFLQYGGVGYTPPNPPIPESFTSFALVSAMRFSSFVLEVELMQRNPTQNIPQRDLCIVFGIKSETEYYYAHIAEGHTDRWHNIHIIDNAPRRPITLTDNGGIRWGVNQWHKFRVVRDVATGNIAVYMDGDLTAQLTSQFRASLNFELLHSRYGNLSLVNTHVGVRMTKGARRFATSMMRSSGNDGKVTVQLRAVTQWLRARSTHHPIPGWRQLSSAPVRGRRKNAHIRHQNSRSPERSATRQSS